MKKFLTVVMALLLSILPLSACKQQSGNAKIRLNEVTHSIFYAPLYVAIEKGYFAEQGIDIDLTNGGGADSVMTALLSGNADVGLMGPESSIYVYLQGKRDLPTAFGQLTQKDGSFLVGRNPEPDFKWENLQNKEILIGRKGGVPAMTFEYLVNGKGLFHGQNVNLNTDVQFNLMTSAFQTGTADYCTMFEPTASEFEENGLGYVLASVGEGAGEIPYTSFIALRSFIDGNKELVKNFLKAIKSAYEFMATAPLDEVASALVGQFPSFSLNAIKTSITSYQGIDAWTDDLTMSESSFNRLQDVMQNAGELTTRVEFNKIVDNSLAQEIFS